MTDAETRSLGAWLMTESMAAREALMKDEGEDFELRVGRWALEAAPTNPVVAGWVAAFEAVGARRPS